MRNVLLIFALPLFTILSCSNAMIDSEHDNTKTPYTVLFDSTEKEIGVLKLQYPQYYYIESSNGYFVNINYDGTILAEYMPLGGDYNTSEWYPCQLIELGATLSGKTVRRVQDNVYIPRDIDQNGSAIADSSFVSYRFWYDGEYICCGSSIMLSSNQMAIPFKLCTYNEIGIPNNINPPLHISIVYR